MRRLLLTIGSFALLGICTSAFADVVQMKDGTRIEGEIHRTGDGWTIAMPDGRTRHVTADQVAGIDVKPTSSAQSADVRLQSLRRAAENLPDIKTIIDRYQSFIDQNHGTPAADAANADLETWRDRQARGVVKVGDKWLTPEQRDALRKQSTQDAEQIHDLLKQSRIKQAADALTNALSHDPRNPSLQYLQGVLQYTQDKMAPARKAFEQVVAIIPDHAPSLNNLAVILWRQAAYGGALNDYERALQAAPDSRQILDNIAEALNALPEEQKKSPAAQKLARHFKETDDTFQKKMAAKGQYRWGSTWVNEEQMKKLQEAEKAIKDELAKMDSDFAAMQATFAANDQRIGALMQAMAVLEQQTLQQTPDGRVIQFPLPQIYYQYAQEMGQLKQQQAVLRARMDGLRAQARNVQNRLPKPKYSGVQHVIDADGMPIAAPTTQPTQPATQPMTRP